MHQGTTYPKQQPEQNLFTKLGMLSLVRTVITLYDLVNFQPLCIVRQAGLWALGTNSEQDVGGPALAEPVLWL